MADSNGDKKTFTEWMKGEQVTVLTRLATLMGTGLAAVCTFIFLNIWDELRESNRNMQNVKTSVAVHENRLDNHDKEIVSQDRRLVRLENRAQN